MVGRGPNEGQSNRQIHPTVKSRQFKGNQALIVVHTQYCVITTLSGPIKKRVGGMRTRHTPALLPGFLDNGGQDADFFFSKSSILSRVGVDSGHGNPRIWNMKLILKHSVSQL